MAKTQRETRSPAVALIDWVLQHQRHRSGIQRAHAMQAALDLAITADLQFGEKDFEVLEGECYFNTWCGANSERFYSLACDAIFHRRRRHVNRSAAIAWERYRGRKPYIAIDRDNGRRRLAVGSELWWEGERGEVTSFSADGSHLLLTVHENKDPEICSACRRVTSSYRPMVKRRIRITREALLAARVPPEPVGEPVAAIEEESADVSL